MEGVRWNDYIDFILAKNSKAISSGKHIFVTDIGILLKQSSLTTAHKNPERNYDNFISLSASWLLDSL